ncbi:glycosyltransferase [Herbiconiux moechotypicola]|uniref:glycosyltransferase n=1 Tax=Herbiconiux moechotypicola TaxID=637393 RepID=UPI00217D9E01|nr:glycosyltransferase [Herbiconiux moechotypicola]MCS5731025.1 glycosyltransferase [Herbiconiux moechotypicola]
MSDDVAAIVTAYGPGGGLLELVESLLPQVARVVVVDDGSDPRFDPVLDAARRSGALVVRHSSNQGIAAALNTGVRAAEADAVTAPTFVLTLDQDSEVSPDFVSCLVGTAREAAEAGITVGMVAPAHVEGQPSPVAGAVRGFLLGRAPIQSGMLIPLDTLRRVGGFAEQLFIDGVDTDFALRVDRAGLRIVLSPAVRLGHSLGRRHTPRLLGVPVRLGGAPLELTHSAPFRYYYIVRNRVLLNRMHGRRHRAWSVRETLADARHLLVVQLLVPGRVPRARAALAGVRDGWAGRSGPMPERLRAALDR